jgi:hypothetical protein
MDPLNFLFWFIVVCCVFAVVIILGRWLLSLTGVAIPPPLLYVAGILLFLFLLFVLWHYAMAGGTGSSGVKIFH